jgi:hypothetical protein
MQRTTPRRVPARDLEKNKEFSTFSGGRMSPAEDVESQAGFLKRAMKGLAS